jgi:GH25 family lysozyme M1 (1,4-beta-N-acetylmuramidase)/LysM repeat protein
MTLDFIDVSKFQPDIEPGNMPDVKGVVVGCTAGTNFVSPFADIQYQKAKRAGKKRGFYHIPEGAFNPKAEADWFVSQCRGYFGDGIPILDWEETDVSRADLAKEFLDEVRAQTGVSPWIYMNEAAYNGANWDTVKAEYSLWIAQYRYGSPVQGFHADWEYPAEVANWGTVAAYQYASTGYINGYSQALDLSVFYGDEAQWDRYAQPSNVHPNPPAPNPPTPIPAPAPAPAPKPQTFTATVSAGDTFTSIAAQFGVSLSALEAVNPGINYDIIYVGQIINVPGTAPAPAPAPAGVRGWWRVDPGDNLTMVSNYYGVSVASICEWNGIANPNLIYVGQMLKIY